MEKVLLVAAGGAVGAVARYALGVQAFRLWGPNWPFGTFIANVSGGLLMGVLAGYLAHRGGADQEKLRVLLGVGVLFKMGAYHMGRGTTPTSIYDIGSLLPGMAAANGRTSLHIAYVPTAGMVRQVKPSPERFTDVTAYRDEAIAPILDAAGIAHDTIPADGHVLIPTAPLRHILQGKKLRDLPAFSRFLLLGFDYLVTTRGAEAATHFEAVGKPAPR